MKYVQNLGHILENKFGFSGALDMFTFNYVANAKENSSSQNDDVFKTEINILDGKQSFEIDRTSAGAVGKYLSARKGHDSSTGDYTVQTVESTKYERDDSGVWVGHKETTTMVGKIQ